MTDHSDPDTVRAERAAALASPLLQLGHTLGRGYFAVQALAGSLWWLGVFTAPWVRELTLGGLDPVMVAALDLPLFVLASGIAATGLRPAAWIATVWTILVAVAMSLYATVTTEAGWGALLMLAAAAGSIAAALLLRDGRLPHERLLFGPFAFRPAKPASAARNVTRTGLQIALFWGLCLGVIPVVIWLIEARWGLAVEAPPVLRISGAVLFALASALALWAAISMSSRGEGTPLPSAMPRRLVISGPYRYVRNPMAITGITQGVAVGLMLGSWLVVVYALCGSLVWNWMIRPLEEADLERRFGAEFDDYRRHVGCWVPTYRGFGTNVTTNDTARDRRELG